LTRQPNPTFKEIEKKPGQMPGFSFSHSMQDKNWRKVAAFRAAIDVAASKSNTHDLNPAIQNTTRTVSF